MIFSFTSLILLSYKSEILLSVINFFLSSFFSFNCSDNENSEFILLKNGLISMTFVFPFRYKSLRDKDFLNFYF